MYSNESTLLLLHTFCVGVKLSIGFKSFINENWNLKKKKKSEKNIIFVGKDDLKHLLVIILSYKEKNINFWNSIFKNTTLHILTCSCSHNVFSQKFIWRSILVELRKKWYTWPWIEKNCLHLISLKPKSKFFCIKGIPVLSVKYHAM